MVGDRARGDRAHGDRAHGDRALARLGHAEPTPIFQELTVDRSRRPVRGAVSVPEPHPGSGPLPVQDPTGRRSGLREVPTVPPPALDGSTSAGLRSEWSERSRRSERADLRSVSRDESPEEELRRRAERRRRPRSAADDRDVAPEGGRHAWKREDARTGRHALRR
ncbi:hypothetical protein [Actinomycetospora straminea]|uniref:hypothetical protein n=1 Tax=Actinomycetospora straminea TaxID=663607 RepID=UPI0023656E52|nr:hypothetical protein [Actinomycetospora straminea]MDD7935970.1 hypothetical protein [Actinomycetospora straminea]